MNYEINLDDIQEYNTHKSQLNTAKAALLVIEMQETFRSDAQMISDKQISNVQSLIDFANLKKIKTIYVRHNDSSDTSQHMIDWWGGDKLEKGSAGWQIIPELDTTNQLIIDKSQYSAFCGTDLDQILKSNHITDVIICGVMTNCCCETAARDAFMRGYNVFFVNDATGTINKELHMAAIKNLAFGFAQVINTQDLVSQNDI